MVGLLIVDDENDILEGLKSTIKWRILGIKVIGTASNGFEAIQLIEQENIDIVLTDIRMPGMDGLDLAKNIGERFPKTKVIIMSGYADFQYAKSAIEYGVQGYILKPIAIKELLEAVHKAAKEIRRMREEENRNADMLKEYKELRDKFFQTNSEEKRLDTSNRIVNEVKEFIKKNYSKSLDVNMLSSAINRSPNYLSHIFSKSNGQTISEYLNRIRINKAKELLKNSDYTVYRIAKEVGYSDEKYFDLCYKY